MRLIVSRCLKAVSYITFACIFAGAWQLAEAANVCGSGLCKPESQHPVSMLTLSDGMGQVYYQYDVDPTGVVQAAKLACRYYADARSSSSYTYTFDDTCQPVLPVPEGNVGGQWSVLAVSGTLRQMRNSDGAVISTATSTWGLLTASCGDAINPNIPATGIDAQCYCNYGYSWSPALKACVAVLDRWFNHAGTCPAGEARYGNPIAPLVASKIIYQDLGLTIGRDRMGISYDSRTKVPYKSPPRTVNGAIGVAAIPIASFGGLWVSTLHKSLYVQRNGTGSVGFVVQAYRGDGQFISFSHPTSTAYVPSNPSVREQLVPVLDGAGNPTSQVRLIDPSGNIELYDMYNLSSGWRGYLQRVTYADGGYINYIYSTTTTSSAPYAGLLINVSDDQGRSLRFQYEAVGRIDARVKSITSADGSILTFAYDAANNLSQIIWADGRIRKYLYERADIPWAVTGIIDENNSRLSTYSYDAQGRAIGTQYAGGVGSYSVDYGTPPNLGVTENLVGSVLTRDHVWIPPQNVNLVLPNGNQSSLSLTTISGMPVLSGQTQPAGSGCAAGNNASVYDSKGNLVSRDDFDGRRTCYAYDSSSRETTRVEGLVTTTDCSTATPDGATLPPGARRITTSWHPDWRKPVVVSRPLHRTTLVYHGQPDPFNGNAVAVCTSAANLPNGKPLPVVCKQIEQTLLGNGNVDTTVAARVSTYVYDAGARVLAATDPSGQAASYIYYGDSTFTISPQGPYDTDYDAVTALLHGNGANGATSFADSSAGGSALAAIGNAKTSTTLAMFGGASIALDGSGDFVRAASSTRFDVGSGDYTIEAYIWLAGTPASGSYFTIASNLSDSAQQGWRVLIDSSRRLVPMSAYWASGTSFTAIKPAQQVIPLNTWTHVVWTRSGSSIKTWVNGVLDSDYSGATAINASTAPLDIGANTGSTWYFNGYIDEFRITKGVARYTASFTPPTAEFPNNGLIPSPTDIGHTAGDLQSITNAAGHVTQFTRYDRVGRVRQTIDPKGVVTDITYTPRGWVSTVTTTAPGGSPRVTSYSYDGVGQLIGATQPDGSTLSYSYDAAHRLVGVTDAKGNSVNYTLDNVGNRIAEDIKDPTGVLQRSISRSFDALNRLQQVSGAAQ